MKSYAKIESVRIKVLLVLSFVLVIFFATNSWSVVQAVSIGEEYADQNNFTDGILVSVKDDDTSSLEVTSLSNDKYLVGVTQSTDSSLVSISKNYAGTSVAISGEVQVLASDINGDIKQGELVTVSWINGVAMKAKEDSGMRIVGIALEDFRLDSTKTYSGIDTPQGADMEARVGYLSIKLLEGQVYAVSSSGGVAGLIDKLAGKEVSAVRLVAGITVFCASLAIAAIFIYSSIRGSFTSFGRNPLASNSIYTGLLQVSSVSVAVISIGATLTYFLWVV